MSIGSILSGIGNLFTPAPMLGPVPMLGGVSTTGVQTTLAPALNTLSGTVQWTTIPGQPPIQTYPVVQAPMEPTKFRSSGLNMAPIYPLLDKEERDLILVTVRHYTNDNDYKDGKFHAGRLPFARRDECVFCLFIAQHFSMKLYQKLEIEDFVGEAHKDVVRFVYADGQQAELPRYRLQSGFGSYQYTHPYYGATPAPTLPSYTITTTTTTLPNSYGPLTAIGNFSGYNNTP